jgi:hypothetical protein
MPPGFITRHIHHVDGLPWIDVFHDVTHNDAVERVGGKRPGETLDVVNDIHPWQLAPVHTNAARLLVGAAAGIQPDLLCLLDGFS